MRRILTSGGEKSAIDGAERIADLVRLTENTHLSVLAGSGLSLTNIRDFVKCTGVKEIHFGTGVREEGQPLKYVDAEKVATVKRLFHA